VRLSLNIASERGLFAIRDAIAPRHHDNERGLDSIVALYRRSLIVARIICANAKLAWDAERICAGMRFRREIMAEMQPEAGEQPFALAA
jgi:hypothetical protein